MHYVTEEWKLEEILIDFHELISEHTGANMAAVVYETITSLGLQGRVRTPCCFVLLMLISLGVVSGHFYCFR